MKTPIGAIALALVSITHGAFAAGPFDGTWSVTQDCPTAPDGALGYKFLFDVTIKDGELVGQYGNKAQGPFETLSGRINSDGSANLMAKGLNGKSEHTVGFQQPGSPFSFPVTARFEANRGTGVRKVGRTCKFTFVKK